MSTATSTAVTPTTAHERGWWLPATPFHGQTSFTISDLIVIIGGIALLFAGWGLQRIHDASLQTAEVGGMTIAYPEGWLPLPALPPAVAQWTDNQGFGATLTLYAEPVPSESAGLLPASSNPAVGQAAYTPIRSEPVSLGDVPAIRSDYAYARQQVATSSPPEIVRGREVSWTTNGQHFGLVLEAPERDWSRVEPLFDSLATAAITGGAS
jgi:hypothetical protein